MTSLKVYSEPEYMSPSSIGTFNQCPMRYKFSKLDRLPEPSTDPQILGSYVHEVLEELFKLPREERTMQNAGRIAKELYSSTWQEEFKSLDKVACDENTFRWRVRWCLENYFELEDPTSFDAAGIEARMSGDIDGVPIYGIIDRWTIEDDKMVVSDYKTGKKPRPQYEWEKKMQIMIYSILLEKETGMETKHAELIYLKSPSVAVYHPTKKIVDSVKATIRQTWDEVTTSCSTGEFETRTGPLCNWCNYKRICPAWG